ncbi:MAG: hypothetical protein JW819_04700 [Candidatus Krumholzibacteriota bacterium]|nr:hypothetical protein [Candidatus Krumholzibacteriota bacterium]
MNSDALHAAYRAAYVAFDCGDYDEARRGATACIDHAPEDSYWHWGAWGLRCWIGAFTHDQQELDLAARRLIEGCPESDRAWFTGLARLTLGFEYRRRGRAAEARRSFLAAADAYRDHALAPDQPPEWEFVLRYFAEVARWAASGDARELETLAGDLRGYPRPERLPAGLAEAADLAIRHARGEAVAAEAKESLKPGLSRAFLAPVLLLEIPVE